MRFLVGVLSVLLLAGAAFGDEIQSTQNKLINAPFFADSTVIHHVVPLDSAGSPLWEIPPIVTYINGRFHFGISTFNRIIVDTLENLTATVDTVIVPDSAAAGFMVRNTSNTKTLELWTNNTEGAHHYILPLGSIGFPYYADTVFMKKASTIPNVILEFGK